VAKALTVPALRTKQGDTSVYALFVRGADILSVADLDRVRRTDKGVLEGFQRKEIRQHVNDIAQYLDGGGTLFPNAIILALEPGLSFTQSRGPKAKDSIEGIDLGRLALPLREEGERAAWIVDGQQRVLAIRKSNASGLVVPVVAFEAASLDMQREQFILVNRARPLPKRLIDELLPETQGVLLPRDLTARQLPSRLCNALNTHTASPFRDMLRRVSQSSQPEQIVTDSALLGMIRRSLNNPNGALAGYKSLGDQSGDANAMLQLLIDFWSAVKQVFPGAWGKPPSESRLMHSAGISAMGELMDRIVARADNGASLTGFFVQELGRIEKYCAWTHGQWPGIDRSWDSFQSTPRDIKALSQILVQIYAQRSRQ